MDISDTLLERRGLIRLFNDLKEKRFVFVNAPAGYGKTVAVTQWLEKDARAKAILSLDEYDNNFSIFCERFCATLRTCQPQNKTLADIIAHPSFQNAPDVFAIRAVAAVSARKKSVIAIDDLHLLHDNAVLQLLLALIKRLPLNFQVILISRHDLPHCFSELWLKGQATRIEEGSFLFTDNEITALYKKRGQPITPTQASDISRQTQGWAMGINAFLLSPERVSVFDYLDNFVQANIWEKWDEETRAFMVCTAMLQELTPSVCEAMTGVAHSDKLLKELVRKSAFITQLQDDTYCYHHLFQQFLRRMAHERGEAYVMSLLEKEGHWHLSQNHFSKAIDCFIRCKNHEGIAKSYILFATSGNKDYALVRLLPTFNHPEVIAAAKQYPHLLYIAASCAFFEGRAEDTVALMDEYYARHNEIDCPVLMCDIVLMRFWDFRISLEEALKRADDFPALSDWAMARSVSMHMPLYHRGVVDFSEVLSCDNMTGKLDAFFRKIGGATDEVGPMRAETVAAGLLYEQGHLTEAYEHALRAMAEMKSHFPADSKICTLAILVCVLAATGEPFETHLKALSQMIEEDKAYHLAPNFNAFIVRQKIAAGNLKAAQEWLEVHPSFGDSTLYSIYIDFTTCRAYIATEQYDFAIILLKKVLKIASSFNRPLDVYEAQILLAITYWKKKRGSQRESLDYLEGAVLAALPHGYVRMFMAEGATLATMLYKLQKRIEQQKDKAHLSFVKMLYLKTHNGKIEKPKEGALKFTDKQKAVMGLLCQGKTRKEIAENLGIKQPTLRTHLEAVYGKLEVSNVTDAVAKINALKLLE